MPTEVRASNAQNMTRTPSENIHKSKEIVLYNPFDILVEEEKITECSTWGPNRSSPLMAYLKLEFLLEIYLVFNLYYYILGNADNIYDPWFVMGDFNTVVDMSEVCGASGDISASMDEFKGCLTEIGLITLSMQGNTLTWHNCSPDSRSLWKRLDRILVNDRWLELWPGTHYVSLNPRTSDHSHLVLKGGLQNQPVMLFQFDNYLACSPNFIPLVHSI
ncbi:UNVERIFIED_CONTAM: hypothetical protein Scaly_2774900 [Sesamum calycinum]|uniref:Endonuclease/exonuclease/phosphatase domain-containing protein n=1 Tax=Sesamum calycinum TaxID=2727403 RepID=A0AAW2IYD4_9LAMI